MCTSGELSGRHDKETGAAGAAWHEVTQTGKA